MKNNQLVDKLSSRLGKSILLISVTAMALLTTGCKSEGTGILGKQGTSSLEEDPVLKNAPFAYDYAADTISYNSCVIAGTSVADPVGLHGLKIGSNEGFVDNLGTGAVRAGVKLRSDFLQYVGKNFSPDYPNNVITPSVVSRVLNTDYSVQNSNAFLQFAVRRKSDYSVIPDLIAPQPPIVAKPPADAVVFTQKLSSGFLGHSITKSILYNATGGVLAEGSRVYDLSDVAESIPIEASFNFNASADNTYTVAGYPTEPFGSGEVYSQKVRDAFNAGTQLLTVTFGGIGATTGVPTDDVIKDTVNNIKRPYKAGTSEFDTTKAYGRGYQLKFDSQTTTTTWPKNRLTQVTELNLDTGTPSGGASWTCEQFPIAPPNHWNNNKPSNKAWIKDSTMIEPNCAPLLADDTTCREPLNALGNDTTATCAIKKDRAEKIKRIRRHYSADGWNIGILFTAKLKSGYITPLPFLTSLNAACSGLPPHPTSCYARVFEVSIDTTNAACVSPYPNSCFITRAQNQLCLSPKTTNSCYLPTIGILESGATVPDDKLIDVGIQYDRTQDCYLTMASIAGTRDPDRKKGRCAQYASVCTRASSGF